VSNFEESVRQIAETLAKKTLADLFQSRNSVKTMPIRVAASAENKTGET
jgi:hypothetical protein